MPSLIDIAFEKTRQETTGDTRYARIAPWTFVITSLSNKGPCGPDGKAIFSLPIAPDEFEYRLPFAAEFTPGQQGGLTVDEAGIINGEIRIGATTGFRPRAQLSTGKDPGDGVFTGMLSSFARYYTTSGGVAGKWRGEISGHLSFWLLAARCFEGYSTLKKDAATAPYTRMELHVPKDELHLDVVPGEFTLRRRASSERVTYRFEVTLRVVGAASYFDASSMVEKSWLDKALDTVTEVRQAVQAIGATVQDVQAVAAEVRRKITNIANILSDVTSVITACTAFTAGTKDWIDVPKAFVRQTADLVAAATALAEATDELPQAFADSWREMEDQLDRLTVAGRNHWSPDAAVSIKSYNAALTGVPATSSLSTSEKAAVDAMADGKPKTMSAAFGGMIRPGDKARAGFDPPAKAMAEGIYEGFTEVTVKSGDTPASLALKHLGDARESGAIIASNQLRSPYITTGARLEGTLVAGDKILIPRKATSPGAAASTGKLTAAGKSQAEARLGSDLELIQQAGGRWGWAVDATKGNSKDARVVSGLKNLSQALLFRLRVTRGEALMFPNLGPPEIVGETAFAYSEAAMRTREQILLDPRIERLLGFRYTMDGDTLSLTAEVEPKGFGGPRTIAEVVR